MAVDKKVVRKEKNIEIPTPEELLIQKECGRVMKFYHAATPQRNRTPRIKIYEALSELNLLKKTLSSEKALELCDEAVDRLKKLQEEEKKK
jgi:hypothetical protein